MSCLATPEAVMVSFWPGLGGSGETSRDVIWIASVGEPASHAFNGLPTIQVRADRNR
jgi:hypothetical protein